MAAHDDTRVKKHRRKASRPSNLPETAADERASRSRKTRHALPRILLRVLLIAAVALAFLWVSRNYEALTPAAISDWLDEKLSGGSSGDGFPLSIDGDAVLSAGSLGDTLAVLSDNALTMYNKNAGEVARRLHNYADPALKLAGQYALVAEIGGTRLMLEKRSGTVLEFTAPDNIVTVALASNGRFAVATGADKSHSSKVTVYDKSGDELYNWVSADLQVVDVAFDSAGRRVAVTGLTARDADIRSVLTILSVSGDEPITYAADHVMLLSSVFSDKDTVVAVGSDVLWMAAADGSGKTDYTYADRELLSFAVSEKLTGLLLQPYGSADGGELVLLDNQGKERQVATFEDTFRCLTVDDDRILLLTDSHLASYTLEGQGAKIPIAADGRLVVAPNHRTLVIGLTAITEYSLRSKSGIE